MLRTSIAEWTASRLEPFIPSPVAVELPNFLETATEAIEELSVKGRLRARQLVVLPEAVFPNGHESRPSKVGEMPRYRGLGRAQDQDQITDANLAVLLQEARIRRRVRSENARNKRSTASTLTWPL